MGRHTRTALPGRFRTWLAAGAVALTAAGGVPAAQAADSAPAASRPDFDADGSTDLVVGVPQDDSSTGRVTVLPGSASGPNAAARKTLTQDSPGVPGADETGDRFGAATATGDIDGDGRLDLVIGAPGEDDTSGHADRGAITVLDGASGMTEGFSFTTTSPSTPAGAGVGAAVTVGDFDDDGKGDILAVGEGDGGQGFQTIRADDGTRSTMLLSDGAIDHTAAVSADFDGDGYDDVAINFRDHLGKSYVMVEHGSPYGLQSGRLLETPGGRSLAVGDLDGDGRDDLVIGQAATAESKAHAGGQVTVVYGRARASTEIALDAATARTVHQDSPEVPGAAEAGDAMGSAVAVADFNGDGRMDVLTGLPGEDTVNGADVGMALLLSGTGTRDGLTGTGSVLLSQDTGATPGVGEPGDRFGSDVVLTDLTGTGGPDLAIGISGENDGDGSILQIDSAAGVYNLAGGVYYGRTTIGTTSGARLGTVLALATSRASALV
ncbi:FG-GAP repeat protein [Streptomyces minutiscleroticus]|uniref:FG-GAP repeat protein n=1 Tax=Streptomyces minutiscleroticus TaxID=68238 RepID=UPI00332C271C